MNTPPPALGTHFDILDPRFRRLAQPNAWLERLYTGCRWAEGAVWFADTQCLIWSDIPNDRMLQWADGMGTRVFRAPANFANGNTRDCEGRLITCEHGARRVSRTELDGRITTLADRYKGKRLNSPNDVVVKSDGSIWFTDPPYGILNDYEGHRGESEIGACNVYRLDPATGLIDIIADDFVRPNGICFAPDESRLYISDSSLSHDPDGHRHIRVFDVERGRSLVRGHVLAVIKPGCADGFRCDIDGNVWTSAADGVHCYAPEGTLIGKVKVPEVVANVCFGGPNLNRLFIAATTSLYSIYLGTRGAARS